jgi:hypothetical protein
MSKFKFQKDIRVKKLNVKVQISNECQGEKNNIKVQITNEEQGLSFGTAGIFLRSQKD